MAGTFNFAPNSLVPETVPPDPVQVVSLGGWTFTSKPKVPFQRRFRLTLHGMRWYLNLDGTYDAATDPTYNARALEIFYQANGVWDNFAWFHPHIGNLTCRFSEALTIPAGLARSGGTLDPLEVMLIEHNPSFS